MKKNGYTLVELIITMALLALASTVIIVNMQGVESKQNKSLKERRIAEIEQAACSAIDSLQAETITGQNRDNCLVNGCKIKLSKLVSEGIIDEDLEFDDDGTKIVDIKELYSVGIKWDTTSDGYKEKKCEFELRDLDTDPIDPEPTPNPNPDPDPDPTPDPNPDPDPEPDPTPEPDPGPSSFDYTGSVQKYIVPKTGVYKLETWGAQGGSTSGCVGGYGAYSTGEITLKKDDVIYIFVGGSGLGYTTHRPLSGGYNGGGGSSPTSDTNEITASGGGATHIAKTNKGTLSNYSNNDEIYIVSAGGGGAAANKAIMCVNGGAGGGISGNNGGRYEENTTDARISAIGYGGTQNRGGSYFNQTTSGSGGIASGVFGSGASGNYTGAGGGYYGGGISHCSAGGGSSYIGNSVLSNKAMYCYNCATSNATNTKTISVTCHSATATSNCAKEGAGYAKISYVKASTEDQETSNPSPAKFDYTGSVQEYTVTKTGKYKLQVWGAQGGSDSPSDGGVGGYSEGEIELNKGDKLYIAVGGKGSSYTRKAKSNGGFNGGGYGGIVNATSNPQGGSGCGGATHIALINQTLNNLQDKKSDILIVAGGGGGGAMVPGGAGGGISGNNGNYADDYPTYFGSGGTQTSGGYDNYLKDNKATFGKGSDLNEVGYGGNGGGGGYYGGGGTNRAHSGGGGGSGYIGNSKLTNKMMSCFNCQESSSVDTKTISTTCKNSSPLDNCAKVGNGYAIISYIDGTNTEKPTENFQTKTYDFTGTEQTLKIPATGTYKLEIWGAQGGNSYDGVGGYGGYSVGTATLTKDSTLYIHVGGSGYDSNSPGYNGGKADNNAASYNSGGGATHIALTNQTLNNLQYKKSEILIVAGGGGAGERVYGGSGGGYIGAAGYTIGTNTYPYYGTGGSQTQGGKGVVMSSHASSGVINGSFGLGGSGYSSTDTGAYGGGGFFGGGGTTYAGGAGGGSGYIGNSLLKNKAMYCYNCATSNVEATKTLSVTCHSASATSNCAKEGNGYVSITKVS